MTELPTMPDPQAEPDALASLDLLRRGGAISPIALDLTALGGDVPFERWEAIGRFLTRVRNSSAWWIGDWINFGEASYGHKYAQAHEATQLSIETLSNYAWVCRQIAVARRRADLSFSHHEVVAGLHPRTQTKWLREAAERGWSRRELRQALRDLEAGGDPVEPEADANPQPRPPFSAAEVEPIVRQILHTAQPDGDAYRVAREPIERLRALCREERE